MDLTRFEKYGSVKKSKHHIKIIGKTKTAYITKRHVSLQEYKPEFGEGKTFSAEEIKRRHLGKIVCSLPHKTLDELCRVLDLYFAE